MFIPIETEFRIEYVKIIPHLFGNLICVLIYHLQFQFYSLMSSMRVR